MQENTDGSLSLVWPENTFDNDDNAGFYTEFFQSGKSKKKMILSVKYDILGKNSIIFQN